MRRKATGRPTKTKQKKTKSHQGTSGKAIGRRPRPKKKNSVMKLGKAGREPRGAIQIGAESIHDDQFGSIEPSIDPIPCRPTSITFSLSASSFFLSFFLSLPFFSSFYRRCSSSAIIAPRPSLSHRSHFVNQHSVDQQLSQKPSKTR